MNKFKYSQVIQIGRQMKCSKVFLISYNNEVKINRLNARCIYCNGCSSSAYTQTQLAKLPQLSAAINPSSDFELAVPIIAAISNVLPTLPSIVAVEYSYSWQFLGSNCRPIGGNILPRNALRQPLILQFVLQIACQLC